MRVFQSLRGLFWRKIFSRLYKYWIASRDVVCGKGVIFYGVPILTSAIGAKLSIGDRVVLCSKSEFTALGVRQSVVIRLLSKSALIDIGDDVGVSGAVICSYKKIVIGAETMIGAGVIICDTDFHPICPDERRFKSIDHADSSPIVIGKNVFIGTGSVVLKGVEIGDNSIIGAGSVVVRSIPSNTIAAGNPARPIRDL